LPHKEIGSHVKALKGFYNENGVMTTPKRRSILSLIFFLLKKNFVRKYRQKFSTITDVEKITKPFFSRVLFFVCNSSPHIQREFVTDYISASSSKTW